MSSVIASRGRFGRTSMLALPLGIVGLAMLTAAPTGRSLLAGGIVAVLGLLLRVWAEGWASASSSPSVTLRGPFRFVRFPQELGGALMILGICLASRSFAAAVTGVLGVPLFYYFHFRWGPGLRRNESSHQRAQWQRVPAFIPRAVPVPGDGPAGERFSLRKSLFTGRPTELERAAGVALVFAFFYVCSLHGIERFWLRGAVLVAAAAIVGGWALLTRSHERQKIRAKP